MEQEATIPVVIGVTGHRLLDAGDRVAVAASVKAELERLQSLCPHSRLMMLNSLAEGADLLCAEIGESLGIPLIAVLPRQQADYQLDFSPSGKEQFLRQCSRADLVFVAPSAEPVPESGTSRDYLFRQAGIYIAAHSHILLALWDGGPGTEAACGTAETVGFALEGSYCPAKGVPVRSVENEAVIHVFTPRNGRRGEHAGTVQVLGDRTAVWDILLKTDTFNRQALESGKSGHSRLPMDVPEDPCLQRMDQVSWTAGTLSSLFAEKYRCSLALLAASGALLAFSFLLYDELRIGWMILLCGVLILSAWIFKGNAERTGSHSRYLEYRVLSECLRVQTYLRYAGSSTEVSRLLPWTQMEGTPWILDAVCALSVGKPPETPHAIRSCWVDTQKEYHRSAAGKSLHRLQVSSRTVRFIFVLSLVLYAAAVLSELLWGRLSLRTPVRISDPESWRTVLIILLGTASAITLLVSGYYGKLSLPRTLSDHQKMERFYTKASDRIRQYGQDEELLEVLAREELAECGSWYSYQRDNHPDMIL